MEQHLFSDTFQDVPVHIQIIQLAKQLYIWVGAGAPKMASLVMAMPTRLDPVPAVTTLLAGPADSDSSSTAQRLAKRTGLSVVASINLPPNSPLLQAFVERRLVQELEKLQLIQQTSGFNLSRQT